MDEMPLGSGALSATPYKINRSIVSFQGDERFIGEHAETMVSSLIIDLIVIDPF